jgi:5-methylthioadenosine/S-adenosylhomocysteine deaminase
MTDTCNEIIIQNGHILTMDSSGRTIPSGYIRIKGNIIIDLGEGEPQNHSADIKVIDAAGGIIMPGMINCHTHIGMSLFRSLADDRADRLRKALFPLEKKTVTAELVYWASLHCLVEMIQGGVSCFADMYYFEDEVARASELAGLRCILGETVLDFPAPDSPEPYGGIMIAADLIRKYKNHPLITPAVAPHAPYSLDADQLKMCGNCPGRPILLF